ncbi:hypothetical protein K1719_016408 [Acacia pycnantha]|nr:hypothetical protein K1719_016408 [Acacia pycnantha]
MEITSVPFLNQEDYSHFYNLYSEMDSYLGVNNNANKRGRSDEEGGDDGRRNSNDYDDLKKNSLRDIFTSLILLDEEDKQEDKKRAMESEQDRVMFDYNHKQQAQAMNDYYVQFQDHYSQMDEFDHSRTKRARRSATAMSASASAAVSDSAFVPDNVGPEITAPVASTASPSSGQHHRRLWVKDRSKDWWERCNHPDFPEEEFRRSFRMSKATFDMICEELDSVVMKKNTMLRDAIPDVWIVGNSGFPLTDWVLVPYTHQNLTWTQHAFNEKIGDVQKVSKEAFARWKLMDPEWNFDLFDDEMVAENNIRSANSVQARDYIAHNLLHHGLAGTSFL